MFRNKIKSTIAIAVLAVVSAAAPGLCGQPSAQRRAYWWRDEIRAAAHSFSMAKHKRIQQWPRMLTPAGSGLLPLPKAAGPITPDGKLDEPAWAKATRFPVGPIFAGWADGPVTLHVSVCHDAKSLYIAIESPIDLTDLGALAPSGELFRVGKKAYRVGPGGGLPIGSVSWNGERMVVEFAAPLPAKGDIALSFALEVVRRPGGKLPAHLGYLGLSKIKGPMWLPPVAIALRRANAATRLAVSTSGPAKAELIANGPAKSLKAVGRGVFPYAWSSGGYKLDGFAIIDPIKEELQGARDMIERSGKHDTRLLKRIDALAMEPVGNDRAARRELYRRARILRSEAHLAMLDAPLLFVRQHPYYAAHIYDDYYTWRPGGGICVLENPSDPLAEPNVRVVIDPSTKSTAGGGVYRDADLSWDAKRLVFAHKETKSAWTCIYEIGVDGRGLKRLTKPEGFHDITPAYLPDGRIVFTSTRPKGLVPCFNSGVDTLHTMNADGSGIRSISSNNVTEFDPSVLPDGRILYGRWEYVDKTALYMQSLWTMFPDGTNET